MEVAVHWGTLLEGTCTMVYSMGPTINENHHMDIMLPGGSKYSKNGCLRLRYYLL